MKKHTVKSTKSKTAAAKKTAKAKKPTVHRIPSTSTAYPLITHPDDRMITEFPDGSFTLHVVVGGEWDGCGDCDADGKLLAAGTPKPVTLTFETVGGGTVNVQATEIKVTPKMLKAADRRAAKKKKAPVSKPEPQPELKVVPAVIPENPIPNELSIQLDTPSDGRKLKRYVSKTDPNSRYHLRDRSVAEKPVGLVRRICEANPALTRKEVLALCIEAGVNKNTAATQYSLWKAAASKVTEEGEE